MLVCLSTLGGVLFHGSLTVLFSQTTEELNPIVAFGHPGDYPSPGVFPGKGTWLVRDRAGFFALSNRCGHLGCSVVEWDQAGRRFICPCHHSQFDPYGKVVSGPAVAPLRPVKVFLDSGGRITVDLRQEVPLGTRMRVAKAVVSQVSS